jgi:hypothetical protein
MSIHIGLIGGGNITETHARAARAIPGAEIAATHGTNAEKIAHLYGEHSCIPYQDFEAFLKHRPMDLVINGSPSGLHASQAAHADALIEAAKKSKVRLGVIFQDRLKPHIRQFKNWVDQGLLGKLLFVDARVKWNRPPEYYANSRWRGSLVLDGGGGLINQGVHIIYLLLCLLGDVIRVQARTATLLHNIEAEDTAAAILEFSSGALGIFNATTTAYPGYPAALKSPAPKEPSSSSTTASSPPISEIPRPLPNPPRSTKTKAPPPPPSAISAATKPPSKIFSKPSSTTTPPPATASKAAAASPSSKPSTAPQNLPTVPPPSELQQAAEKVKLSFFGPRPARRPTDLSRPCREDSGLPVAGGLLLERTSTSQSRAVQ